MNKSEKCKAWRKTRTGVINTLYGNQISNAMKRGRARPNYSRDQLSEWLHSNNFENLFAEWEASGYDKWSKPSCDRIDDSLSYELGNIQLVTWKENYDKARLHQRIGKLESSRKRVSIIGTDSFGNETLFPSIHSAARYVGGSAQHIWSCCNGGRKSATGWTWKYAEEKGKRAEFKRQAKLVGINDLFG